MSKYSENMPPDLKTAIGWMYDFIKPNTTFLDIGCSTGYFGSLIKQAKQAKVYGVEISEDAKQARKVLDGVYEFDLDGSWPKAIYQRKYDYAFFGDVLEHLKNPGQALVNTRKLLKPGGLLFVSIPNIAHLSIRIELLKGSFEYEPLGILDDTHLKYFTLRSFSELANNSGFRIKAVDYNVNDFPREVATKLLAKYGLKPIEKFWQKVDSIEARAYQYKFIMTPSTKKTIQKKLPTKPLPDKPLQQRDDYIANLRTQAEVLHKHSDEQAKIIKHYFDLSQKLETENKLLKSNLGYKVRQAIKRKKVQ